MYADVGDATKQEVRDLVQLIDGHRSQLDRALRVVDVVYLETTVAAATRLVRHDKNVTRIHTRRPDIVGAVTRLRRYDTYELGFVGVLHVPDPDTGFIIAAAW